MFTASRADIRAGTTQRPRNSSRNLSGSALAWPLASSSTFAFLANGNTIPYARLTVVKADEGRAFLAKPGTVGGGDKLGLQSFVRSLFRGVPPWLRSHGLGSATKRARLALDFADDLVERDDVEADHALAARNMKRDVTGDFVDLLAVRHEIRPSEHLGC